MLSLLLLIGLTRGRRAHLTRHEEGAVLELLTLIDSRASFPNDLLTGNRGNNRALLVALNAMRMMAFADLSFTGLTLEFGLRASSVSSSENEAIVPAHAFEGDRG